MRISVAHLAIQGQSVAVFDTDAANRSDRGRDALLIDLVARMRHNRRRVDKAALAFVQHGQLAFYGDHDLVRYLSRNPGSIVWTDTLDR